MHSFTYKMLAYSLNEGNDAMDFELAQGLVTAMRYCLYRVQRYTNQAYRVI